MSTNNLCLQEEVRKIIIWIFSYLEIWLRCLNIRAIMVHLFLVKFQLRISTSRKLYMQRLTYKFTYILYPYMYL